MKYLYLILAPILFIGNSVSTAAPFPIPHLKLIYSLKDHSSIQADGSYKYVESNLSECKDFSIDIKINELSINGDDGQSTHQIITKNIRSNIMGKWYEHTLDNGFDVTAIITRKLLSYDYDSVELNLKKKTYWTPKKSEISANYFIINDFIVADEIFDGLYYFYFVTSMTEDKIEYIDCFGNTFSEEKFIGQKKLEIPSDFVKE